MLHIYVYEVTCAQRVLVIVHLYLPHAAQAGKTDKDWPVTLTIHQLSLQIDTCVQVYR